MFISVWDAKFDSVKAEYIIVQSYNHYLFSDNGECRPTCV